MVNMSCQLEGRVTVKSRLHVTFFHNKNGHLIYLALNSLATELYVRLITLLILVVHTEQRFVFKLANDITLFAFICNVTLVWQCT